MYFPKPGNLVRVAAPEDQRLSHHRLDATPGTRTQFHVLLWKRTSVITLEFVSLPFEHMVSKRLPRTRDV